ncbi:thioredoxin-like 3-2, chloroplastic [Selaginella moellendorffii]|uniref:thioredoxin-like 3-2, chloroplastic n=1 Tax=Selaginella moellendorffii TaxID=88036 RepID=UPI000D1C252A|nr:thioredoxin-like 3-2, chloroplastic [Selaginella moellendorffii]|eukprot:XP_024536983.1 thioredoxin-like 3-2, chloroplastic [Selaginella moellendorffii]
MLVKNIRLSDLSLSMASALLPSQSLIRFSPCPPNTPNSRKGMAIQAATWWGGIQKPDKVELQPITSEEEFDRVLLDCQESNKGAVIEWMALWCRKCIYLKPKLEKLGAEFYPHINFYCVDVNCVPKSLIERASVTKMPTIQLWRNGEKQGEVIGGHQAWLVLDEVRDMLKKKR